MIIKEINIENFGKFHNKKVTFEKGTNIVYGENEAGKTTIHTFIRGMLFGIEKSRGRGAGSDVYSRYEPWENSSNYSGSMRINSGGVNYRIERNFNKDNKSYQIINEDMGMVLSDEEVKELFHGFDESSYYNTISVSQLGSATDKELEIILKNYAANLMSTKNSELDMQSAIDSLKTKKKEVYALMGSDNEITLKKKAMDLSGKIEELESKDSILEERIAGNREARRSLVARNKELVKKQDEYNETSLVNRGKSQAYTMSKEDLEKDIKDLKNKDEKLRKERSEFTEVLTDNNIKDEEDLQNMLSKIKKIKTKPSIFSILMIILYFLVAGVFFTCYGLDYKLPLPLRISDYLIVGIVACAVGVFFVIEEFISGKMRQKKKKREMKEYENIKVNLEKSDELLKEINELEEELRGKSKRLFELNREINVSDEGDSDAKDYREDIRVLSEKIENLKEEISRDEWELEQGKDALENAYTEKEELSERLEIYEKNAEDIKAINLAISTIEEIGKKVRSSFGSGLNEKASEYLEKLTNGKYNKLYIDDKLNISINSPNKLIDSNHLSKGTLEQIYLCLRLAAADILFENDKKPILMDDAMAMYDNKRMGSAMKFMDENLEQIIIFSCHTREKVMADKIGLDYNLIRL